VKNPNLDDLPGLGAGAGAGVGTGEVSARGCCLSVPFSMSGVGPREGTRVARGNPLARLGLGDGFLDEDFIGTPNLALPVGVMPALDSDDGVRRCDGGKAARLLCMIGDGPRRPGIEDAPSLLGRVGLRGSGGEVGG